jgi:hypothetical protein
LAMLWLTLIALQAATPTPPPPPNYEATADFYRCVVGKAKEWAPSKEEAKVIVETAMSSCGTERGAVVQAAAQHMQATAAKDLPASYRREGIEKMVQMVDDKVRTLAYETVIKARMPH